MKVQVAYTGEGKLLAGTIIRPEAPAHCRILPADGYRVSEFYIPAEHVTLDPADLWLRVRIDVSTDVHTLIIDD